MVQHFVATARARARFLAQAPDLVDVMKSLCSTRETAEDGDTVNTPTRSESQSPFARSHGTGTFMLAERY